MLTETVYLPHLYTCAHTEGCGRPLASWVQLGIDWPFEVLGSGIVYWAGIIVPSSTVGTWGMEVHRQTVADGHCVTLAACLTSHKCVCCDIQALQTPCLCLSLLCGCQHCVSMGFTAAPPPLQVYMLTLEQPLLFSTALLRFFS